MIKKLKFAPHLVPLILSGEKTTTWRLFDDKNLQVGDELEFVNRDTGQVFAKAKILSVREKPHGAITDADYTGHERYESREKMLEAFRSYYGDQVTPESIVKIIKFDLMR